MHGVAVGPDRVGVSALSDNAGKAGRTVGL